MRGHLAATVGTHGTLSGDFSFEREATTTLVGLGGAKVNISGTDALTDGEGALVLQSNGIAGYLTGKAAAAANGVQIGGRILFRVNTTGHAVDATANVGGHDLTVSFGEYEGDTYTVSVSDLELNIGGGVIVKGSGTFTSSKLADGSDVQTFAGSGLTIFFGEGPLTLANGEQNPLARGLLITSATVGLIRDHRRRLRARRARHRADHRHPGRLRRRPHRPGPRARERPQQGDRARPCASRARATTCCSSSLDGEKGGGTTPFVAGQRDRHAPRRPRLEPDRRLHVRQGRRRPEDHGEQRRDGPAGSGRVGQRARASARSRFTTVPAT